MDEDGTINFFSVRLFAWLYEGETILNPIVRNSSIEQKMLAHDND